MRVPHISSSVTLVAVTKTFPVETIIEAYANGIRHFGENYVEEFEKKYAALPDEIKDNAVFHMIGHVQSRKVKDVVRLFHWVDSVDSIKLGKKLSSEAERQGLSLSILLEVNLIGEASKFGFDPETLQQAIDELIALPNLRVEGLMVMPPLVANAEENREVFRSAKRLFDSALAHFSARDERELKFATTWRHLSMGTSQDFRVAIEEGATMVRLGTAIFGPRQLSK